MKNAKNYTSILVLALLLPLTSKAQKTKIPDIEMVFVKGGTFTMGCTDEQTDCEGDESPAHRVTLNDYSIGKYEITQAQWRAVMGTNPSTFSGCDDCPVENISWQDASAFCKKLSKLTGKKYSLPTEAQWEYAARGGSKGKRQVYSGSDKIAEVSWYNGNSDKRTHQVGTKKSNELGIYDLSGNVWEWCNDWYGAYTTAEQTNPQGASDRTTRVLRGGGWRDDAQNCRVAFRGNSAPTFGNFNIGFRVALVP